MNENGRVDGGLTTVKLPTLDVVTLAIVICVELDEYTVREPM